MRLERSALLSEALFAVLSASGGRGGACLVVRRHRRGAADPGRLHGIGRLLSPVHSQGGGIFRQARSRCRAGAAHSQFRHTAGADGQFAADRRRDAIGFPPGGGRRDRPRGDCRRHRDGTDREEEHRGAGPARGGDQAAAGFHRQDGGRAGARGIPARAVPPLAPVEGGGFPAR